MISASEALICILQHVKALEGEEVPLSDSLHRYLAARLIAPIDLPPFDNSAMDGFAIRSEETRGASETNPVRLRVIGTTAAGEPAAKIGSGETIRIMTGAAISEGADAVVPFEECRTEDSLCLLTETVVRGDNLRHAGEDIRRGESVLAVGERITPRTLALAAALGLETLQVFRRPRVKILSTGSELVPPGLPLGPGKIYNSNGPALTAALRELGIEPEAVLSSADSEEGLQKGLGSSLDADCLLTVGGVSAGDFDLVPKALKDLGAEVVFHKVSIKPGKPLLFAVLGKTAIFSLPGNPVSALMTFDRFVHPALLKMMGAGNPVRGRLTAVAEEELSGSKGKEDYLRGIVTWREGRYVVRSAGSQGSARLVPLAHANATIILPADRKRVGPGETVEIEWFS